MSTGGEEFVNDDGTFEINDAGERVLDDSGCPQNCASVGGLSLGLDYEIFPVDSNVIICPCCAPFGWDITIAGNASSGPLTIQQWLRYCTETELPPDTFEASAVNGTYPVAGPWFATSNGREGFGYMTVECAQTTTRHYQKQILSPYLGQCSFCPGGGSDGVFPSPGQDCYVDASQTFCANCAQFEWGSIPHYHTPGDSSSVIASLELWVRIFAYPMVDFTKGGTLFTIFYGTCTLSPGSDGKIRYDCNTNLVYSGASDPYLSVIQFNGQPKAREVCSGGTLTVSPCPTGPLARFPSNCGLNLCGGTDPYICIAHYTTQTNTFGSATAWDAWTFTGSTKYYPSDPFPLSIGIPVVTRKPGGGCTAEIFIIATSQSDGSCNTPPVPPLPGLCPPPRYCCVVLWESFHYTTGWSTPHKYPGGAFCIDTSDPSVQLDGWGALQDGCRKFFCRYLGQCTGPDDTSSCAGLDSDVGPPVPTDDPECYAANTAPSDCHNCPDGKVDRYRFDAVNNTTAQNSEDYTITGPFLDASNIDLPYYVDACEGIWQGPNYATAYASFYKYIYVCHGKPAPSMPAIPTSSDYN